MRITLKLFLGLILLTFMYGFSMHIDKKTNVLYEPAPLIVCFKSNSHTLSLANKSLIDKVILALIKNGKDSINILLENNLALTPQITIAEYKINKYLGVQRAIEIIDYASMKYKLPRSSFVIKEFNKFSNNIEKCSGILLYLE